MRITRCDQCGGEAKGLYIPEPSWIEVEAAEDEDHGQFCCWWCLALWSREKAIVREGLVTEDPSETTP